MAYVIVLLLDDAATQAVRQVSNRLDNGRCRTHRKNRWEYPHISLLHMEGIEGDKVWDSVAAYDFSLLGPLLLSGVGVCQGDISQLYLHVQHSGPLTAMHGDLAALMSAQGMRVASLYQPGHWEPRVVLANGIFLEGFDAAKWDAGTVANITAVCEDVVVVEYSQHSCKVAGQFVVGRDPSAVIWRGFAEALSTQSYFRAHEILETLWRREHGIRQQSAIWVAALFVHWHRAQYSGALKILDKIRRDPRRYPSALATDLSVWHSGLNHQGPPPTLTVYQRLCLVRWARHDPL